MFILIFDHVLFNFRMILFASSTDKFLVTLCQNFTLDKEYNSKENIEKDTFIESNKYLWKTLSNLSLHAWHRFFNVETLELMVINKKIDLQAETRNFFEKSNTNPNNFNNKKDIIELKENEYYNLSSPRNEKDLINNAYRVDQTNPLSELNFNSNTINNKINKTNFNSPTNSSSVVNPSPSVNNVKDNQNRFNFNNKNCVDYLKNNNKIFEKKTYEIKAKSQCEKILFMNCDIKNLEENFGIKLNHRTINNFNKKFMNGFCMVRIEWQYENVALIYLAFFQTFENIRRIFVQKIIDD